MNEKYVKIKQIMKGLIIKNQIGKIISNNIIEKIFFCMLCATIFTGSLCHWILDISYKYRFDNIEKKYVDYNWIFVVAAVISMYYLFCAKSIKFDFALFFLCQGLALVAILDYHRELYDSVNYAWILPIAYISGKLAAGADRQNINNRVATMFWVLAFGLFCVSATDMYNNFRQIPIRGLEVNAWSSFWLNYISESRCTYEMGFVLVTSSLGYSIYKGREKKLNQIIIILLNIAIQICCTIVTGRANRLLLPITFFTFTILYLYDNWDALSRKQIKTIVVIVVVMICILLGGLIAFVNNWFGLYTAYLDSSWAGSGGTFTNVRFTLDYNGFMAMLKYPLEDYYTLGLERPHSMLLDYGRAYDLTIYVLLVIYRLITIKDAIILAFIKNERSYIKYLLIPGFLAINLEYSMEPNGFQYRHIWMAGLLISGLIRAWLEVCGEKNNVKTNVYNK